MIEKLLKILKWTARISFAAVMIVSVAVGYSKPLADACTGFLLTFLPGAVKNVFGIHIPIRLEMFFVLFVYLANFLGSCLGFYDIFHWWDIVLHASSGAFIAVLSLSVLNCAVKGKSLRDWNPLVMAVMMLTFAVACGTLWEFFEYGMDTFFGTVMQRHTMLSDGTMDTGLIDTMSDELFAAASAVMYTVSASVSAAKGKYRDLEQFIIKRK